MKSVGIRELRQRASEVLRQVQAGQIFEVTDRGRAIAMLGPIASGTLLEQLSAAGDVVTAVGSLDELKPLVLRRGQRRPSKTLALLRAHER